MNVSNLRIFIFTYFFFRNILEYAHILACSLVSTLLTDSECSYLIFLDRQTKSATDLTEKYVEKNEEGF